MFGIRLYRDAIQKCLNTGVKGIAIYPYGKTGKELKNALKEYFDIEPSFIVDNFLCKEREDVVSLEEFKNSYTGDVGVIFTVENEEIYEKLGGALREFVRKDRIIDLRQLDKERTDLEDSLDRVKLFVTRGYTREDEYEKRWEEIKSKYRVVKIYKITVDAIGEMLARYFVFEKDKREGELHVLLPVANPQRNKIVNAYAYKYVGMPDIDEVIFWLYVIREHSAEVDTSDIEKYMSRQNHPVENIKAYSVKPHFLDNEIVDGNKSLREMGVKGRYVCISARTSQYNSRTMSDGWNESIYDYRNGHFENYRDTIKYLADMNLQTIKMGKYEDPITPIDNCIDYAGKFSNDFMDLYIASKCEFWIGFDSGIILLAQLFTKPVLMINTTLIGFGKGGLRNTEYDMYIPKKLYDASANRYLTIKEMFELDKACKIDGSNYKKYRMEENTALEILDAAREMIARINGTWVDTEEDKKNIQKYKELYHEIYGYQKNNPLNWIGEPVPFRLATSFIRHNPFLLE